MPAFKASREIAASAEHVIATFSDVERLARWWGWARFTVDGCEFLTGGLGLYDGTHRMR
ncbi:MAG: hypothetical protein K1X52_14300 [Pyrinomonadaceae bacterium]|nr:hypothetical protein [Pyrinomonadaceae bacterium]